MTTTTTTTATAGAERVRNDSYGNDYSYRNSDNSHGNGHPRLRVGLVDSYNNSDSYDHSYSNDTTTAKDTLDLRLGLGDSFLRFCRIC